MASFRPFPPNGIDPWGSPLRNWAQDVESAINAAEATAAAAIPDTEEGRSALAASPELSAAFVSADEADQKVTATRMRLAASAGYDAARSMGAAAQAQAVATTLTESWADLAAWAVTTTSLQVSGGKVYGGSGTPSGGANRAFAVASGVLARAVFKVRLVPGATSGQGVLIGFNRGAAGAAPAAGGAQARGVYFRSDGNYYAIKSISDGTQTDILTGTVGAPSDWIVTLVADENYVSLFICGGSGNSGQKAVARWARDDAGYPLNNLSIMINDSRGTSGSYVYPITEARIGGLASGSTPTTSGVGVTGHYATHRGDNFLIMTPSGYDSRRSYPAVIVWHGNGSDVTHWITNANGKAVADAFLANGYIVIAAADASTTTWGNDAGLAAYVNAFRYARDHYNISAIAIYANSMGGIESLNALARDAIPGVAAWVGTVPTYDLVECHANALFTSTIDTAYAGNFAANSVGHDPAQMSPLAFRGVPMWMLIATDDAAVTPSANGQALYVDISAVDPSLVTRVEVTGGHSTSEIASRAQDMVSFCNARLGLLTSYPA